MTVPLAERYGGLRYHLKLPTAIEVANGRRTDGKSTRFCADPRVEISACGLPVRRMGASPYRLRDRPITSPDLSEPAD